MNRSYCTRSLINTNAVIGARQGGPTDWRSAAVSAPRDTFKKGTISRAKRSAARACWTAASVMAFQCDTFILSIARCFLYKTILFHLPSVVLADRLLGSYLPPITRVGRTADTDSQVLRGTLAGHVPSCASNTGVRRASELMPDRVVHLLRSFSGPGPLLRALPIPQS